MNTRECTISLTNRTHTGFAVSVITALILTAIGEMSASGVPEDNAPKPAPPYAQSSTVDYDSDAAFIQRLSAPAPKIAPGEKSQEGLDGYDKANSLNPKHVWAYIERGNACSELGQYQKAIDHFGQVIDLDPQDILVKELAYVQRGNAYLSLGLAHNDPQQYKQAIEDLTVAINLGIDNENLASLAYSQRASAYSMQGQKVNAIRDCNQAIKLDPNNHFAFSGRARAYNWLTSSGIGDLYSYLCSSNPDSEIVKKVRSIGDYAKAKSEAKSYKNSSETEGLLKRSHAMSAIWNIEDAVRNYAKVQAIEDYTKAIFLAPSTVDYYEQRADAYHFLGKHQQAIQDYTKAICLNPKNSELYCARASVYDGLKQYQKAVEDYTRAMSLSPKNASLYVDRAQSYEKLGQHQHAIADFDKAISINSRDGTDSRALGLKGDLYLKLAQRHKAIGSYAQLLRCDFGGLDLDTAKFRKYWAYSGLSKAYRELGLHEKGIENFCKAQATNDNTNKYSRECNEYVYFNDAIKEHPKEAWSYTGRGNAQLKQRLYKDAIEDCSIAIALDRKYAQAYVTRGKAYRKLEQHQKATEDFQKAVSLDPSLAKQIALRGFDY